MSKRAALLLIILVACALIAPALASAPDDRQPEAKAPDPSVIERYCGHWHADEIELEIAYEDDAFIARLLQYRDDGDVVVWGFTFCWYDDQDGVLRAPNCTHYLQYIDFDALETTEEDWWETDLGPTWFAVGDDTDALVAHEVEGLDTPLTLLRGEPEPQSFGF